jgi:lauroyl/myristoyl acyltransferase
MARFFRVWPDRLREPRWIKRCRFVCKDRVDAALESGRPIVLATVHFANITEIYHWLRADGKAVAFLQQTGLTWDTSYRDYVETLADVANGLEGVPRRFGPEQSWDARDFLTGGNRIIGVAVDQRHPRAILARGPHFNLRCMPGGLQLAAVSNAVVIPCIIRATWGMRSEIYFGEPVPDELLTSRRQHTLAMEHILRELSPWIIANPEQCAPHLVAAIELDRPAVAPDHPMSAAPTSVT